MPRFFFNLRNDIDADDPEGTELPDLAAAKRKAEAYAIDMAAASITEHHKLNLDHRIEIADAAADGGYSPSFNRRKLLRLKASSGFLQAGSVAQGRSVPDLTASPVACRQAPPMIYYNPPRGSDAASRGSCGADSHCP